MSTGKWQKIAGSKKFFSPFSIQVLDILWQINFLSNISKIHLAFLSAWIIMIIIDAKGDILYAFKQL